MGQFTCGLGTTKKETEPEIDKTIQCDVYRMWYDMLCVHVRYIHYVDKCIWEWQPQIEYISLQRNFYLLILKHIAHPVIIVITLLYSTVIRAKSSNFTASYKMRFILLLCLFAEWIGSFASLQCIQSRIYVYSTTKFMGSFAFVVGLKCCRYIVCIWQMRTPNKLHYIIIIVSSLLSWSCDFIYLRRFQKSVAILFRERHGF